MKKSFILLSSIILIVALSFYSINILKNKSLFSNINIHKYLHMQAVIHLDKTENFIKSNTLEEISNFTLTDSRYNMKIITTRQNDKTLYHVSIETSDDTNIRVYKTISK